jgi:hypothetical protein
MIVTKFCCDEMKENFQGILGKFYAFNYCPYCGEKIYLDVYGPMTIVHCESDCRCKHEGFCCAGHLYIDKNRMCKGETNEIL